MLFPYYFALFKKNKTFLQGLIKVKLITGKRCLIPGKQSATNEVIELNTSFTRSQHTQHKHSHDPLLYSQTLSLQVTLNTHSLCE